MLYKSLSETGGFYFYYVLVLYLLMRLKHVFLIYKNVRKFTKADYKILDKRSLSIYPAHTYSSAGSPVNTTLKLPVSGKLNNTNSNTVFITDTFSNVEAIEMPTEIKLFELHEGPVNVEIFSIKKRAKKFEVWLNYSGNKYFIGEPKRDDFYLFTFEKNKPVTILINGEKNEISKNKREKVYLEHVYLLEYLGEYKVTAARKEVQYIKKEIPFEKAKTINLRRLFY